MALNKFEWKKYGLALLLSFVIFTSGLYIGSFSTDLKVKSLYNLENSIRSQVMGVELQYEILENNPCLIKDMKAFTEDIEKIGSRLTAMETQMGANNKVVVSLKEYYSLLQIRHYLFMKKVKETCNRNYDLVLYFYSNAGDCDDCKEQGYVLSYVNKKNPLFNTYSFDVNINNPAISTLKQVYNVTKVPTIVINDVVYAGFQNKDKLMKLLVNNSTNEN